MKQKKIVLIGGAGFIGHNLALKLKDRGHNPIIIDSLGINNLMAFSSYNVEAINSELYLNIIQERQILLRTSKIPLYVQDARDYHALSKLFALIKPHVVIHLAAVSHAGKSNKDPYTTFDHSMRTLENALDASRDSIEHFIYFSSSMVYGNFKEQFVNEKTICNPIGIYGALKYGGEKLVIAYNQVFDLSYTIIRPSALYGQRCVSRRVGQIFIENALTGDDITLNGDGSDMLDFTYIDDLVQGITLVIENDKARNETFNLTYGEARTIGEMADILKNHFAGIRINYLPKDSLTPKRGTLNVDKAKKLLGYQPKNSIDIGYPKYIEWYKAFWDTAVK